MREPLEFFICSQRRGWYNQSVEPVSAQQGGCHVRTVKFCIYLLILCIFLTACGKAVSYEAAAEETAAEKVSLNYGQIESDFSGLTPGVAAVFLGIMDDLGKRKEIQM